MYKNYIIQLYNYYDIISDCHISDIGRKKIDLSMRLTTGIVTIFAQKVFDMLANGPVILSISISTDAAWLRDA